MRAARWTPRPTYESLPTAGSPVWMPIRTRISAPWGHEWATSACWARTAAVTASFALWNAAKKGIALRVDLPPTRALDRGAKDFAMRREHLRVPVAELLQHVRRAFDVGEEKRHGPAGEVRHQRPP